MATAFPDIGLEHDTDATPTDAWVVILFDDPVNTMEYVSLALRTVLEIDAPTAERYMLAAHTDGRAAVYSGDREAAERICVALHGWTLQATVTR